MTNTAQNVPEVPKFVLPGHFGHFWAFSEIVGHGGHFWLMLCPKVPKIAQCKKNEVNMFTINVKCYDVKSHKITERVPKQKEASLKIVLLFVACYEIPCNFGTLCPLYWNFRKCQAFFSTLHLFMTQLFMLMLILSPPGLQVQDLRRVPSLVVCRSVPRWMQWLSVGHPLYPPQDSVQCLFSWPVDLF